MPGLCRRIHVLLQGQTKTWMAAPGSLRSLRKLGCEPGHDDVRTAASTNGITQPLDPRTPSKPCSSDGRELALIDLREELIFSRSHLLWARSIPLSRLELRFARLVPRRDTRIVLCDDGDGLVERAAKILAAAGYTDISYLQGGVAAWEKAGLELFSGVNVPSKAFGEHIEHACDTPSISRRRARRADAQRHRHGRGRQPAVRRIPARLDSERHQRAGRRAGAAHPRHRALARYAGRGQLRRPHPQHHRRAIADQRRPAEQGGGAAQRHHGLDACRAHAATAARPSATPSRPPSGLAWAKAAAERVAKRFGVMRIDAQGAGELPRRRRRARSMCSTCAIRPNTPPAIVPARSTRPAASSCRPPTNMPARSARASCWSTTARCAR